MISVLRFALHRNLSATADAMLSTAYPSIVVEVYSDLPVANARYVSGIFLNLCVCIHLRATLTHLSSVCSSE